MKANHYLTPDEETFLHDMARVLEAAKRVSRGIDDFREIPETLAAEWVRRLTEMTGR